MAKLASVINNLAIAMNTPKGEKPKYTKPLDFLPNWDGSIPTEEEKETQTVEDMMAAFKASGIEFKKGKLINIES